MEIKKFAFVLNRRVDLHAIDATPDFHTGECAYDDAGNRWRYKRWRPTIMKTSTTSSSGIVHFADDLGRRLSGGNEVDRKFMETL